MRNAFGVVTGRIPGEEKKKNGRKRRKREMGSRKEGTAGWSFADADVLADRNTREIVSSFLPSVPRGIKGSRHKGDAVVKRDT